MAQRVLCLFIDLCYFYRAFVIYLKRFSREADEVQQNFNFMSINVVMM